MKTALFASAALLSLGLVGCGNLEPLATFSTAVDINGANPEAAIFPVFGSDTFLLDVDGDGTPESLATGLILISSDNPAICDEIQKIGLFNFIEEIEFRGGIPGTTVLTAAMTTGELSAGDSIQGNGVTSFVLSEFSVSDGVTPQTQAFSDFFSGTGRVQIDDFVEGELLSGSVLDTLVFDNVQNTDIQVAMTGTFQNAQHCQAISDDIVIAFLGD